MLVTMTTHITGTRNGEEWPAVGGTIELPDGEAAHLIAAGLAVPAEPADTEPGETTEAEPGVSEAEAEVAADEDPYPVGGSIKAVLAWVGTDPARARYAQEQETAGDKRKGLLGPLDDLLADA